MPRVQYSTPLTVFATLFYVVILLLATLWNGFVIVIFAKDRYLLQEPSSLFLLLLTIVDLLEAVLAIPFYIVASVGGGWIIGDTDEARNATCVAIAFVFIMFLFGTVHLLAVISFDRFLYIAYPLKYRKWMSIPRSLLLVAVVSLIPLILACMPLLGFGRLGYSPNVSGCTFRWEGERQYVILVVVEAMIPIIVTGVFTLLTFIHVKRFIKRRHIRQKSIDMSTELNRSVDRTLTRTFVLLLISQVGCFAPGIVTALIGIFIGFENIPVELYVTGFVIIVSSVAINPIIQATSRTRIRHYLAVFLLFIRCRKSQVTETVERSDEVQEMRTNEITLETRESYCNGNTVHTVGPEEIGTYPSFSSSPNRIIQKYDMDPINGTLV